MLEQNYEKNPFIVMWELTRACQLNCLHCRAVSQKQRHPLELSLDEAKNLVDEIYDMNNPLLVFTGGDPLERPDVFDIAKYAIQKGMRVSISPSATPNVTKEIMKKAKESGLARWSFSLDGHCAGIHDHFRGTPGSFELTMNAITYLHELEMPLQINTVISRYNFPYLEEMAALVEKLGVVLWNVFFLVPTGRGKQEDMITPEEHERVFRWLYQLSKRVPFDIKTTAAQHYRRVVIQEKMREQMAMSDSEHILYSDVLNKGKTGQVDGLGRAPRGVNDGNGFLFISHIGEVYPSGLLPLYAGNVRETPLATIYRESEIFKNLRSPDQYKGKCGVCEFNKVCGGSRSRAYSVTGDYMQNEPYCIYIPKALRKKQGIAH